MTTSHADRGITHWWTYSLPREHERTFRRYMARNKQFKPVKGLPNPIPFPELVTPDQARWYAPSKKRWVQYNALKQGLVTALDRGWLPEAPDEVEDSGETPQGVATGESGKRREAKPETTCDVCGQSGFASKTGVKIHKTHMHPEGDE